MKKTGNYFVLIICVFSFFIFSSCEDFWYPEYTYSGGGGGIGANTTTTFDITVSNNSNNVYSLKEVKLITLTHTNASDLSIAIISPNNSSATLINQEGGSSAYNGTYTFVNSSDSAGLNRIVTFGGTVIPETYQSDNSFEEFVDDGVQGTWTLRITNFAGTAGNLTNWEFSVQEQSTSSP